MVSGTEKQTQLSVPASKEQHMPDPFPGKSDSCYLNIQKLELRSTMKKINFDRLKLGGEKDSFITLIHD